MFSISQDSKFIKRRIITNKTVKFFASLSTFFTISMKTILTKGKRACNILKNFLYKSNKNIKV